MLPLREKDRVRILAATARRSGSFGPRRIAAITGSLLVLAAIPALGLFRMDVWSGEHVVLNEPATTAEAVKAFIIAMAILYGTTFLSNTIVGRFFCGWGCPVGYVSRLGEDVDRNRGRVRKVVAHLLGAGFVASFVAAVMAWWVHPRVLVDGSMTARAVTVSVFAALSIGGFLHAFVWRFGFCLHVCPIGLYYRYVTSRAPVGIVFDEVPNPCIQCGACETVCPVVLDPKRLGESLPATFSDGADVGDPEDVEMRYGDAECIRCGDCVEACRLIFSKREGEIAPLRFGRPT